MSEREAQFFNFEAEKKLFNGSSSFPLLTDQQHVDQQHRCRCSSGHFQCLGALLLEAQHKLKGVFAVVVMVVVTMVVV